MNITLHRIHQQLIVTAVLLISLGLATPTQDVRAQPTGCCVAGSGGAGNCAQTTAEECSGNGGSFNPAQNCSEVDACNASAGSSTCGSISKEEMERLTGRGVTTYVPDISIPGFTAGTSVEINGSTIANYIRGIFIIFIWSVGVLAVVMVIYGGIKWVAAGGNPGLIGDAKDVITNAIIGLVIALTSFLVLRLINPEFTNFTPLSVNKVSRCSLALISKIIEEAGTVADCSVDVVNGPPQRICFPYTNLPCIEGDLNQLIMSNDDFTRESDKAPVKTDAVLMKAIILGEAGKGPDANTITSVPTAGPACGGNTPACKEKKGTAYGIVQANHDVLKDHWPKIGTMPDECSGDDANYRAESGSLKVECARKLDGVNGVELQLKIMASALYDLPAQYKKSPTLMAAAYHLGGGGAASFLAGKTSIDESTSETVKYIKRFNNNYKQQCNEPLPDPNDRG